MRRALACLALVACGGKAQPPVVDLPEPGPGGTYTIRLNRASHPGDRGRVLLTGDDETLETVRRGAEVLDSSHERKSARLQATSVVLDAPRGEATRIGYEDAVLEYEHDGRRSTLVSHGRIELARAQKSEAARITVDGAPASAEVRAALDLVVSFTTGGPSDDEIFGTRTPQPVGAHWKIDAERARADLASDKDLRAASVAGDAWLERLERVAGVDCLDVSAHVVVDGIDTSSLAGNGARVEIARATASFSGSFPIDAASPRLADRQVFEMTLKLHKPTPDGDVDVEIESASHQDARHVPSNLAARGARAE